LHAPRSRARARADTKPANDQAAAGSLLGECPVCEEPLTPASPSLFWCSEECQAVWQHEPESEPPALHGIPPESFWPAFMRTVLGVAPPGMTPIALPHPDRPTQRIVAHNWQCCAGQRCPLHNPSDHPLKDAPMRWRGDVGIIERTCPHGIDHPDPDDLRIRSGFGGVHSCDGCCRSPRGERT
jgi:hypothetical protein